MADDSSSGSSLWLPAGFRFHPTDEEIIVDYLQPKVADQSFSAVAMGEVDLNSCEPWELPRKAKMGEKMWYFFWQKDRKYPTGSRTNRATKDGYWKATGKDKEIYKLQQGSSSAAAAGKRVLVGMKKTLVFYLGRAPKGEKTNWVMHEFRLQAPSLPPSNEEWVVCRIFHKNEGIIKPKSPGAQVTECHPSSALMMSTDQGTSRQQQMSMSMSTPMIATSNNNIHQESTHYFFSQMPPPNPFFSQSGLAASGYLHLQEEAANAAAAAAAAACASTSSALTGKCKVEQAVSSSMPSRSQDTGISNDWHADTSSYDGGEVDVHSNSAGPLLNLDNIWEY